MPSSHLLVSCSSSHQGRWIRPCDRIDHDEKSDASNDDRTTTSDTTTATTTIEQSGTLSYATIEVPSSRENQQLKQQERQRKRRRRRIMWTWNTTDQVSHKHGDKIMSSPGIKAALLYLVGVLLVRHTKTTTDTVFLYSVCGFTLPHTATTTNNIRFNKMMMTQPSKTSLFQSFSASTLERDISIPNSNNYVKHTTIQNWNTLWTMSLTTKKTSASTNPLVGPSKSPPAPSMFLQPGSKRMSFPISTQTSSSPSSTPRQGLRKGESTNIEGGAEEPRRVLGFDIFQLDATRHPEQQQRRSRNKQRRPPTNKVKVDLFNGESCLPSFYRCTTHCENTLMKEISVDMRAKYLQ